MGATRFRNTTMGGSRLDGPILRSRNRRTVRGRLPNFDWVYSRVLKPCLVMTVLSALAYCAAKNLLNLQPYLEKVKP